MPRWVYTEGGRPLPEPVEVSSEWTDVASRAQTPTEELTFGGMAATDGTLINTKKKHREYMKQNGLTTVDDFKDTWAKQKAEREKVRSGQPFDTKNRREAIGRALHTLQQKARKTR